MCLIEIVGSGYDLKIQYSNMTDSTPGADDIAEKELNYLEPNRKVIPGGASGVSKWSTDRFHHHKGGKGRGKATSKGKSRGKGRTKGFGKAKKQSADSYGVARPHD